MRFCTVCGKENLDPNSKFCNHCGAKMEVISPTPIPRVAVTPKTESCPKCGATYVDDTAFCTNCGARKNSDAAPIKAVTSQPSKSDTLQRQESSPMQKIEPKTTKPQKKRGGRIVFIVILLLLLAGIGGACVYALKNGIKALPVVGQFFSKDSEKKIEKETGDMDAEELTEMSVEEKAKESPASKETSPSEAVEQTDKSQVTIVEQTNDPQIKPAESPTAVFSTSEMPDFPAAAVIDGSNDTAWATAVDVRGSGGNVTIPLGTDTTIYGIYIKNGSWKSQSDLLRFSRVEKLLVSFDDGSSETINISDSSLYDFSQMLTTNGEAIPFELPHTTSTIKITVTGIYPGTERTAVITGVSVVLAPIAKSESPAQGVTPSVTDVPAATNAAAEEAASDRDYILPFSSTRALTDADLSNLTKDELRLARNEIYARYGRQFKDETLQRYFDTKAWYANLRKLPLGTEPTPTTLELSNLDLIRKYEER